MDTKHTPVPWHVSPMAPTNIHASVNGKRLELFAAPWGPEAPAKANTARAVACVNACAGIADPAATLAEVRKTLERCIMALAANGAPNCEAVKESRALIAKLGKG